VTPDAFATIATAPSVINGIVVVVVGGSVVVVVVVVVVLVVVAIVVVVVVDVDVVLEVVVVVGTAGGPKVQLTNRTAHKTVEISISRRASIRSSCPLAHARTSRPQLLQKPKCLTTAARRAGSGRQTVVLWGWRRTRKWSRAETRDHSASIAVKGLSVLVQLA